MLSAALHAKTCLQAPVALDLVHPREPDDSAPIRDLVRAQVGPGAIFLCGWPAPTSPPQSSSHTYCGIPIPIHTHPLPHTPTLHTHTPPSKSHWRRGRSHELSLHKYHTNRPLERILPHTYDTHNPSTLHLLHLVYNHTTPTTVCLPCRWQGLPPPPVSKFRRRKVVSPVSRPEPRKVELEAPSEPRSGVRSRRGDGHGGRLGGAAAVEQQGRLRGSQGDLLRQVPAAALHQDRRVAARPRQLRHGVGGCEGAGSGTGEAKARRSCL